MGRRGMGRRWRCGYRLDNGVRMKDVTRSGLGVGWGVVGVWCAVVTPWLEWDVILLRGIRTYLPLTAAYSSNVDGSHVGLEHLVQVLPTQTNLGNMVQVRIIEGAIV